MEGPLGSVEGVESGELERLRRRAYGRDADIAGDVAAQARLFELEAAHRRQLTPVVDAAPRVPAPVPVTEPVEGPRSTSMSVPQAVLASAKNEPAEGSVTEHDPVQAPVAHPGHIGGVPPAPWWRRRRWLMILGGATAALALITVQVAWMSQQRADESTPISTDTSTALPVPDGGTRAGAPDAVLALVSFGADADEPRDPRGALDALGLTAEELRQYENFDGTNVWSGESRFGMVCLLVVLDDREATSAEGCSPQGLETSAEVVWFEAQGLTRFVLNGDHVEVYVFHRAAHPPEG